MEMSDKGHISELVQDDKNFNKHTEYGMGLLEKSVSKFGMGRSILVDKNNKIIAGNGITETAGNVGIEDVQFVDTDGKKIIAVRRTDIDLDTPEGREMALADNATGKANLQWDEDNLGEVCEEFGIDAGEWGLEDWKPMDEQEERPDTGVRGSLAERFIVPPFTVLDSRKGEWRARKQLWNEQIGDRGQSRECTLSGGGYEDCGESSIRGGV